MRKFFTFGALLVLFSLFVMQSVWWLIVAAVIMMMWKFFLSTFPDHARLINFAAKTLVVLAIVGGVYNRYVAPNTVLTRAALYHAMKDGDFRTFLKIEPKLMDADMNVANTTKRVERLYTERSGISLLEIVNAYDSGKVSSDSVMAFLYSKAEQNRRMRNKEDSIYTKISGASAKVRPVSYQPEIQPPQPQPISSTPTQMAVTVSHGEVKTITVGKGFTEIEKVGNIGINFMPSDSIYVVNADGSGPHISTPTSRASMPSSDRFFMRSLSGNPVEVTLSGY